MPRIRIHAGRLRGRYIQTRIGAPYRPLSARLCQAVFNRYRTRIPGTRFLDGFAGSGLIGIHALSLGAIHTLFIERDRQVIVDLQKNLERLGLQDRAVIRTGDIRRILARPPENPYDILFLGPPFDFSHRPLIAIMDRLVDRGWTHNKSLLLIQRSIHTPYPKSPHWVLQNDTLRDGDNVILVYQRPFLNETQRPS